MTHRSRTGGPVKQRGGAKKKTGRKLHHPPPPPEADAAERSTNSAEAYLESPTDGEILEIVHHALRETIDAHGFPAAVQKVKGLLYDQKWLEVFTDHGLLESYAGRWVPSRACCYRELFATLDPIRQLFYVERGFDGDAEGEEDVSDGEDRQEGEAGPSTKTTDVSEDEAPQLRTNILSLGGGASTEVIAVASLARACQLLEPQNTASDRKGKSPVKWNWTGVDIGKWDHIVDKFQSSLQSEWELSRDILNPAFVQGDLLSSPSSSSATADGAHSDNLAPLDIPRLLLDSAPNLITILFTLTELLTQSRPSTFAFLRSLTQNTSSGTLLLVADSASDISEFEMGSSGRKWPIYMILDTILLGPPNQPGAEWECVEKEDSRWYRLPPGVGAGWPVKLENTRYWYRLYRRI